MKNKRIIFLLVILTLIFVFNIKSNATTLPCFSISSNNYSVGDKMTLDEKNEENKANYEEAQKAIQEAEYSYYMRGINLQYNSMKAKFSLYSPEEATSQNMNYLVCSAFVKNVYYESLGIKIPPYTYSLLDYSNDHIGNPEVITYVYKNNKKFVMKQYDENQENNYKETTYEEGEHPSLTNDIIPNLQIRRCTYTFWPCDYGV